MQPTIIIISSREKFEKWLKISELKRPPIIINFLRTAQERQALSVVLVENIDQIPQNTHVFLHGIVASDKGEKIFLDAIEENFTLTNLSGLFLDCSYMAIGDNTKYILDLIEKKKVPNRFRLSLRGSNVANYCYPKKSAWGNRVALFDQCMKVMQESPVSFDLSHNLLMSSHIDELKWVLQRTQVQGFSLNLRNTNNDSEEYHRTDYTRSVKSLLEVVREGKIPRGLKLILDTVGFSDTDGHTGVSMKDQVRLLLKSTNKKDAEIYFAINSFVAKNEIYNQLYEEYSNNYLAIKQAEKNNGFSTKPYSCYQEESLYLTLHVSPSLNYRKGYEELDIKNKKKSLDHLQVIQATNSLCKKFASQREARRIQNRLPYNTEIIHHELLTWNQLKTFLLKEDAIETFSILMDCQTINWSSNVITFLLENTSEKDKNKDNFVALKDGQSLFYQAQHYWFRQTGVEVLFYRLKAIVEQTSSLVDKNKIKEINDLFSQFIAIDLFIYRIISIINTLKVKDFWKIRTTKKKNKLSQFLHGLFDLLISGYAGFNNSSDYTAKDLLESVNEFFKGMDQDLKLDATFNPIKNYIEICTNNSDQLNSIEPLYMKISEEDLPVCSEVVSNKQDVAPVQKRIINTRINNSKNNNINPVQDNPNSIKNPPSVIPSNHVPKGKDSKVMPEIDEKSWTSFWNKIHSKADRLMAFVTETVNKTISTFNKAMDALSNKINHFITVQQIQQEELNAQKEKLVECQKEIAVLNKNIDEIQKEQANKIEELTQKLNLIRENNNRNAKTKDDSETTNLIANQLCLTTMEQKNQINPLPESLYEDRYNYVFHQLYHSDKISLEDKEIALFLFKKELNLIDLVIFIKQNNLIISNADCRQFVDNIFNSSSFVKGVYKNPGDLLPYYNLSYWRLLQEKEQSEALFENSAPNHCNDALPLIDFSDDDAPFKSNPCAFFSNTVKNDPVLNNTIPLSLIDCSDDEIIDRKICLTPKKI